MRYIGAGKKQTPAEKRTGLGKSIGTVLKKENHKKVYIVDKDAADRIQEKLSNKIADRDSESIRNNPSDTDAEKRQKNAVILYQLGDIVQMKKPHPCGSKEWEILRTGADFKLRCRGCGHEIMLPRRTFEKSVRRIIRQE